LPASRACRPRLCETTSTATSPSAICTSRRTSRAVAWHRRDRLRTRQIPDTGTHIIRLPRGRRLVRSGHSNDASRPSRTETSRRYLVRRASGEHQRRPGSEPGTKHSGAPGGARRRDGSSVASSGAIVVMDDAADLVREFLVESHEGLDQVDRELVALEREPRDAERLASVFRTFHTIKGTCGFLGFSKLEAVTHAGEHLLSRLRDGGVDLTPDVATALLALVDAVRQILTAIEATG